MSGEILHLVEHGPYTFTDASLVRSRHQLPVRPLAFLFSDQTTDYFNLPALRFYCPLCLPPGIHIPTPFDGARWFSFAGGLVDHV